MTDPISEAKAKALDPWLVVGGDFNQYDTSRISQNVPELIKAKSGPTRGEATLDYSFTNFDSLIENVTTCFPVEREINKPYHNSVVYESILTRRSICI